MFQNELRHVKLDPVVSHNFHQGPQDDAVLVYQDNANSLMSETTPAGEATPLTRWACEISWLYWCCVKCCEINNCLHKVTDWLRLNFLFYIKAFLSSVFSVHECSSSVFIHTVHTTQSSTCFLFGPVFFSVTQHNLSSNLDYLNHLRSPGSLSKCPPGFWHCESQYKVCTVCYNTHKVWTSLHPYFICELRDQQDLTKWICTKPVS